MNETKLSRIEREITGAARKVYDRVPMKEAWTMEQIACEIRRCGLGIDRSIIDGCLNSLRGKGLIREPEAGLFIRVQARVAVAPQEFKTPINQPARVAPTEEEKKMAAANVVKITEPVRSDALSKIAGLAQSIRQIADDLDGAVLEYAERTQAIERDTDKLRQLQTLLKSLGQ